MRASSAPIVSLNGAAAEGVALALCSLDLGAPAAAGKDEWIHIVPAGEIRTEDGRGPYRVADWDKLVSTSLNAGDRLILDENHSTDLAAPKGLPAPAAGWIEELQHRADGLWGRVAYTPAGRRARQGYRGISPALLIDKAGNVLRLLRASLVNLPNLKGLAALHAELHQEHNMNFLAKLAAKLRLADGASEDAVLAALDTQAAAFTALQARVSAVAKAAGVAEDAEHQVVLNAIATLSAKDGDNTAIVSLQTELTAVTTQLNELRGSLSLQAAETFVDGAIKAGRVGVKALRDHYVERHQKDAASVEKEIGALPILNGQSVVPQRDPGNGDPILTAEDERQIQLMGLDRDAFIKTRKAEEARLVNL